MSDDTGRDFATRNVVTPVRRGGRVLASFATLLALAALGLAGYPYYQRFVVGMPAAANSGELDTLRAAQQRQSDELARLTAEATALNARMSDQQIRIDTRSATEAATVNASAASTAMPDRALKLAEAMFLVQGANDRLLVTRDVRAALAMLLAAQSIVDHVDDAALTDVRAVLSSDIAALRNVTVVDIDATFAQLQALQRALPDLPARGARFVSTPVNVATDAATSSTAALAWQKFLSLFEFHRQSATARPPLGPDEAAYLRVNLGLMLQTAELALLRHDAVVYRQSLESVRRWLEDYLDTNAADVAAARAEIDRLLAVQVDRTLPDVGGSLAALREITTPAPAVAPPSKPSDAT
jgi:uroporphyrin-3 C-methyltransferase